MSYSEQPSNLPLEERGFETTEEQIKILEDLIASTADRAVSLAVKFPNKAESIANKAKDEIAAYQRQIDALTNPTQE